MSKASETPTLIAFLRRLRPGTGLTWADLDAYLDGSEQSFAKDCRRLWRGLDRKGIRILPLSPGDERDERCYDGYYHSQSSLRSDGMQAYERELGRLPRLSRIGEFRFARRYSFYRSWLDEVLGDCGFDEPRVKEILLKEDLDKIEWPAKATRKPERIEHAKQRLTELTELRNVYLHGVLYIVMSAVHKYRGRGIETPDLIQEGNVSLYQAFEGFDWRRDVRFKTYAEYWVNQAFLKILYNSVRTVRVPVWVQKALKKIKDLQARVAIAEGRELSNAEIGKELDLPEDKVKDLIATQRYAVSIDAEIGGDEDAGRVGDLLEDESAVAVPDQIEDVPLKERLTELLDKLNDRERMILELRFGLDGKEPRTLSEVGALLNVSAERVRQLQEAAIRRLKLPGTMKRLEPFLG